MSDKELLGELRETFPVLDRWRLILASEVEPARDSELAEDDLAWRPMRISSLAIVGLGAAREHLHAIRLLVEAGELFPSATATLARTALIGAAQTVWILEPDERTERLRRSLSLAYEDYSKRITFGEQSLRELPPDDLHPEAGDQLRRLKVRRTEVKALLQELGGRYHIDLTNVVVSNAVTAAIPNPQQRALFLLQWRSMSGAVHALLWHHYGQAGTAVTDLDDDGIGLITAGGDVDRLITTYFPAYHVARAGWELFARRAGIPELVLPQNNPRPNGENLSNE